MSQHHQSSLVSRTLSLLAIFSLVFALVPGMQSEEAKADQFTTQQGPPTLTSPSISKDTPGAFESFRPMYPRSTEVYTISTTVSKPGGIAALNDGVSMCLWVDDVADCDEVDPHPQKAFVIDWNWSADADRDEVSVRGTNSYSADATRSDYDATAEANTDVTARVDFKFQVSHAMRNSFEWNLLITADDGSNTATVSRDNLRVSYFGSLDGMSSRSAQVYTVAENSSTTIENIGMGQFAANAFSRVTMAASDFEMVGDSSVVLPITTSAASDRVSFECSPSSNFSADTKKLIEPAPQEFRTVNLMSSREGPESMGTHACRITYGSNLQFANTAYQNTVTVAIGPNSYNAPSFLNANNATAVSVDLEWGAPTIMGLESATLVSYRVEISDDGGTSWSTVDETTNTSYQVTGLAQRSSYDFRVSATTSLGAGSVSTSASTDSAATDTLAIMQALNTDLRDFSETTSASTVVSKIEEQTNIRVFATPRYGSMAELMGSQTNQLSSTGVFSKKLFDDDNNLMTVAGFGAGNNLNGKPFIGFAGFANGEFLGIGLMAFAEDANGSVDSTTYLKDLFVNDHIKKQIYTYVLNANGTVEDGSSETGTEWTFSNNQRPNSNGYYSSSRISADDGIWGFAQGHDVDGNSPGPGLHSHSSVAYGIQNYNAGDSSYRNYYWGGSYSSSNATFYFFHGIDAG